MKFLKNNLCTILTMAFVITLAMTGNAFAEGENPTSSVFEVAVNKLSDLFTSTKSVLFIIGGFGLVALAFQAIFGKLKWAWFAALALGLAIIAAAGKIVEYASTGTEAGSNAQFSSDNYQDSY